MLKCLIKLIPLPLLELFESLILKNFSLAMLVATKSNHEIFEIIGQKKALRMFRTSAKYVPAYNDFLKKKGINPELMKSISDFDKFVPEMTKKEYIKKYAMEEICLHGNLPAFGNIDESAGSTGEPTNWVRALQEERFLSKMVRFEFDYDYEGNIKKYIVLSAWASGPWATGVKFCELMQNYALVKNTDADVDNIIRTIKKFGKSYNYLIAGYPPFLKQLIDEGSKEINWKKYSIDILTGGEGFIPEWRDYISSKLSNKPKIISAYGASDIDIGVAVETPFTIFIRDLVKRNLDLRYELCNHRDNIPMVFQFSPFQHYIKNLKCKRADGTEINEFHVTTLNPKTACPKIKYNLHDEGNVLSYKEMLEKLKKHTPDYKNEFKGNIKKVLRFPFLLVIGRSDGTISLDGANVYPQNIATGIHSNKHLLKLTSNFKISAITDKKKDIEFYIYIELNKGSKPSKKLKNLYSQVLFKKLLEINADYRRSYRDDKSIKPIIKIYKYSSGPFEVKSMIKNKYII